MTKKELFTALLALVESSTIDNKDELANGLKHEIELLAKKSATPRKPTAVQVENEAFKTEIVAYLTTADAPKNIKEIQEAIPTLAELSNQRITHLLSALVENETLIKGYVKKTPYYSINS